MENYKLVLPEHLNHFGDLFGGNLLKWVDESAWIAATREHPGCRFVTIAMDEVDRQKAQQAYNRATTAPVGEQITWSNPNTGNSGSVTPTREGTSSTGAYCREFQQTVTIGGQQEEAYGVACRQPDGAWEIQ